MQAEAVRFASGSLTLEGRIAVPGEPRGVVVLCHAYPPLGGSMSNALLPALQRGLFAAGWAALRFNFRGVGRSEGSFDGDRGEVDDARAALAFARRHTGLERAAIAGWSFGALVGLCAAVAEGVPFAGIAPPVSAPAGSVEVPPFPENLEPVAGRALLVYGTEDAVARREDVESFGKRLGATVVAMDGAGHFFDGRQGEVSAALAEFFEGVRFA